MQVQLAPSANIKPYNPQAELEGVQYFHRPVLYQRVPPVAKARDKTPFAAQWWKQQLTRCKLGWVCPETGEYDNPAYYFHNNFLQYHYVDERTGKTGYNAPHIIDSHRAVFNTFYGSLAEWKNIGGQIKLKPARGKVYTKGRRAGFTTDGWGFTMWYFVCKQDSDVAHLYPDELTRNRENLRVRRMYARLHDQFKYDDERHALTLVTQNMDVLEQGYWIYSTDGSGTKTKVVVNRWYFAVASGDPGVLRGEKMGLIFIVEAGKWKNLKDVIRAQVDCLKIGNLRFGTLIIGGTSDMITNDSEDYKEIYYEPDAFDLDPVFLSPTRGRTGFIDYLTGKSKEVEAREDILLQYEKAEKSGNPLDLQSKQQELPLYPELCFIPPSRNEYDKIKLDQHHTWLLRNIRHDDFLYGKLAEERTVSGKPTGRIIFEPVENGQSREGLWKLLRSALLDPGLNEEFDTLLDTDEFVIGFDDVAKNLKAHEINRWNSKGAFVVINRRTRQIVGSYVHRPTRPVLHEQGILALKFWPGLMNYEYNDDVFFEKLEAENMLNRVIYWHDKGWGPKEKPGMYPQGTIEVQTSHMSQAINRGDYKQWMYVEAITELRKWQSQNTDFSSAHHLANIGLSRLADRRNDKPAGQQNWTPVIQFGSASLAGNQMTAGGYGYSKNASFCQLGTRQ